MKSLKLVALLICLTVIIGSFAGCAPSVALTFEYNHGEAPDSVPEFYKGAELDLPEPARDYYKFIGWSLAADLSGDTYKKLPGDFELTEEQIQSGLTLYAVWERLTGKITFDTAGGEMPEGEFIPDTYNYGANTRIDLEPEREFYEFVSWALNGKNVDAIGADQTGDVTLVAVWVQVETKINFNLGAVPEADLPDALPTFDTEDGCVLTDEEYIPSSDRAIFLGWYDNPEFNGEPITEIPANTTEEVTVYAKWQISPTPEDSWAPNL